MKTFADDPEPSVSPMNQGAAVRSHARTTRALKWVRRAHMYTGLLMAPWILMYGLSGFVFNHVGWFGTIERTHFAEGDFAPSGLSETMNARALAGLVVARVNAGLQPGQAQVRLLEEPLPEFPNFTSVGASNRATGETATLFVDIDDRGGFVQKQLERPARIPASMPRTIEPVFDPATVAEISAQFSRLGARVMPELQDYTFGTLNIPDLLMLVEQGGTKHVLRANLRTGTITARPKLTMPFSTVLMRMHMLHHYPKSAGWKMIWAVVVDLSALLLCFWAISGMVMWFQMKNLRLSGAATLGLAAVITVFLGAAVYGIVTNF